MTTKRRILIVDDNKMALRLTTHLFQRAQYEVYTATNGAEGLAKAVDVKPDLMILDVMMPDMSGLQVCQKLRANPSTARLPVIMLSARGRVNDKLNGFKAGADDYVQKPVDPKELLARAGALLERTQRAQPKSARIIGIVGSKGGVGVTTVAVNVAVTLANQGKSVILAELRPHRGTVVHNLNLAFSQDLGDLLPMDPANISRQDVTRRVGQHKSGLRALVAPQQSTDYPLTAAHVKVIVEALSTEAKYLILDLPTVAGEAIREALDQADQVLLVTEPEPVSVACARADLETLRKWDALDRTNMVIVSRVQSGTLMSPEKIKDELNVRLAGILPPAPEAFYLAASVGIPLVVSKPNTLAAKNLMKLAKMLTQQVPVAV